METNCQNNGNGGNTTSHQPPLTQTSTFHLGLQDSILLQSTQGISQKLKRSRFDWNKSESGDL